MKRERPDHTLQPTALVNEAYLRLVEKLISDDPANARNNTGTVTLYMGLVFEEMGNYTEAGKSYREALAIREELFRRDSANEYMRWFVIEACGKAAKALAKTGARSAALENSRRTLSLLDGAGETENADLLTAKAAALIDIAETHVALAGDRRFAGAESSQGWQTALELYQQSLDMMLDMKNSGALASTEHGTIEEVRKGIMQCKAALARSRAQ